MRKLIAISVIILQGALLGAQIKITDKGQVLSKFLDGLQVDRKWLSSGQQIDWQTGELSTKKDDPANMVPSTDPKNKKPQPAPAVDKKINTHCSSFVAAACARLGIYILCPPEHSTVLLSNAQYDWLLDKGPEKDWNQVLLPTEAQELANQGNLVVAVWRNPDFQKPGHIVIIRPCTKNESQIATEGPDIIQAGTRNYNSTTLKEGFKNHKGAFDSSEILFFSHEIPAKK
ncbi:MAG TPA: hypothetical protein DET40_09450 [Lentisphaeria bacterium]|nr:MAG: hypothetical protein A2X45_08240 [Lentisphaerae bacterium GWF2_50_93]HCE43761.1 hypothetical protein [Lentisphaeria bacterium]